jgi:hypothetical protein
MRSEQQRLTATERANLTAYLDGELNEAESHAIATKLTQSVSARREKEALERTWELLDHLTRPKAPDDFKSRTVSQASQAGALDDRLVDVAGRSARLAGRVLVAFAVMLLTVGVAYALTRWVWPDPSARLARELPVAEHLDEYREVGNFEFLKQLDELPAFNEDAK